MRSLPTICWSPLPLLQTLAFALLVGAISPGLRADEPPRPLHRVRAAVLVTRIDDTWSQEQMDRYLKDCTTRITSQQTVRTALRELLPLDSANGKSLEVKSTETCKRLSASVVRKTNIIVVHLESEEPAVSVSLLQAILAAWMDSEHHQWTTDRKKRIDMANLPLPIVILEAPHIVGAKAENANADNANRPQPQSGPPLDEAGRLKPMY